MRIIELSPHLIFENILDEVNMSPSALKSFASSDIAQRMTMGFEAEIIVPNLESQNGTYLTADYSNDPPFPLKNYHDKVLNFLRNNGQYADSGNWISKRLDKLEEEFYNFNDEQFYTYIYSSLEGIKLFRANIGRASGTTDPDKISYIIDQQLQPYYDLVIDEMSDKFKPPKTFTDFLKLKHIETIGDFAHKYDIRWPYKIKDLGGRMSIEELALNFKNSTSFNTIASEDYHKTERKPGLWIFEPDGSIKPPNNCGGIELISPPMLLPKALNSLNTFWDWATENSIISNNSCGFHVGVSLPSQTTAYIDPVKLLLFLGDDYILKVFGRVGNEYAQSTFKKLKLNADEFQEDENDYVRILKYGLNSLAHKTIVDYIKPKRDDHYLSVNIRNEYIEFRAAGGNYLEDKDKILNTIYRYIRAMSIAADPKAEQHEYVKKLYKILTSSNESNKDSIFHFSKYVAGEITKGQLKQRIRRLRS